MGFGSRQGYPVPLAKEGSQVYEEWDAGDDGWRSAKGDNWQAQAFTPSAAHYVRFVRLLVFREGAPGQVTVSIRATDVNEDPTGPDLVSGVFDGDSVVVGPPEGVDPEPGRQWQSVEFESRLALEANTKYAIVVRAPSGDISNTLGWRVNTWGSNPNGGGWSSSNDGGASWSGSENPTNNFLFSVWD